VFNLPPGRDAPEVANVAIAARRGKCNECELDKAAGTLFLDRANGTTLGLSCRLWQPAFNSLRGWQSRAALLIIDEPVPPGVVAPSRPINVLCTVDYGERGEKLVCVSADDVPKNHFKA
jgi:inorganic pyrophosphatase